MIELLVVIGIISLLIAIILPVLGGARDTAKQSISLSALRQMMVGYSQYQYDYDGQVLWGFTPITVGGQPIIVDSEYFPTPFGAPVSERYPWRFDEYINDTFDIFYPHQKTPDLPGPGDPIGNAFLDAYNVSLTPTFGINSVYVGGHAGGTFQGFDSTTNLPNVGAHVVFNELDVNQPSELIVFTEVKTREGSEVPTDPIFGEDAGLFWTTPPFANGQRWGIVNGEIQGIGPLGSLKIGVPISRNGSSTPTAYFDGHAASETPETLFDMRLWYNDAKSATDDPI